MSNEERSAQYQKMFLQVIEVVMKHITSFPEEQRYGAVVEALATLAASGVAVQSFTFPDDPTLKEDVEVMMKRVLADLHQAVERATEKPPASYATAAWLWAN